LKESVNLINQEGLENRYTRHRRDADGIQAALEALGFTILAAPGCRASTLSVPVYPEGIDDNEFRSVLTEEGVVTAAGLAAYAGKSFRLGHMGNIDKHVVVSTLAAIERALHRVGRKVEFGTAIRVYMEAILKG
jgi:aspartate aminotransferase-like enzyme